MSAFEGYSALTLTRSHLFFIYFGRSSYQIHQHSLFEHRPWIYKIVEIYEDYRASAHLITADDSTQQRISKVC